MDKKYQERTAPVPWEKHFEIFKTIEGNLKEYLNSQQQGHLLIGLRVAYDEKDSSNEPDILPYSLETGYLEFVDMLLSCGEPEEIDYEEMVARTSRTPLPIQLVEEQLAIAKKGLEDAAAVELNVGIDLEVKNNPIYVYSIVCGCKGNSKKPKLLTSNNTNIRAAKACGKKCP